MPRGSQLLLLLAASAVRACSDDNTALKEALKGGGEPCRVPMCRHRCAAAYAEGFCEADRGPDAVRAACPASCGMCGEAPAEDLGHLDIGARCDIARVADASTMSAAQFLEQYVLPQRPVILGGLLDHWSARHWAGVASDTTRCGSYAAQLPAFPAARFNPARPVCRPHRARPTAEQWAAVSAEGLEQRDESAKKELRGERFFRTELGRSRRKGKNQYLNLDYTPKDLPTRRTLQGGYAVPSLFKGDVLQAGCHSSLPHRWLMLSAAGGGSQWHIDPFNASAWNGLLMGRKRWAMHPPHVRCYIQMKILQ